ncbi:hypothetical protein yc1106_02789 [Curvularia clavata]|uniref:Uncharacterized protein n=1 Tax=Curvularia clavata TaxID=95742 RepID=A0A9Q8Z5G3_CURCL|nr:hypothetical protein yc1106_02789 [Curvularia clavata]
MYGFVTDNDHDADDTQYAYSAWAPQFADKLQLSATQSNIIGTAANLGMYAAGIPMGIITDRKSPRLAAVVGMFALFVGYYPIKLATLNWPTHRGSATACPLAAFGLSAFFYTLIAGIAFPGNTSGLLTMLSFATSFLVLVSIPFLIVVDHKTGTGYAAVPTNDRPRRDSNVLHTTKPSGVKYKSSALPQEEITAEEEQDGPSTEVSSLLSSGPGDIVDDDSDAKSKKSTHSSTDITGLALLSKLEFWQLWVLMGLLSGVGLMTINNIGHDVQALWKHWDQAVTDEYLAHRQLWHVSIISLCSFLGRLSSGIGSDFIVKRLNHSRFWCAAIAATIFAFAQMAATQVENPHFLWAVSGLCGLGYGVLFGVFPALVVDAFGPDGFAVNWGFMTLAPVVTGNIFNLFYGAVYDSNSVVEPDGQRGCELGLACYRTAYYVTLTSSVLVSLHKPKSRHPGKIDKPLLLLRKGFDKTFQDRVTDAWRRPDNRPITPLSSGPRVLLLFSPFGREATKYISSTFTLSLRSFSATSPHTAAPAVLVVCEDACATGQSRGAATPPYRPNHPLTSGLIIAASVIVAAGIAIYESPQVRQWADQTRRKIAIALHNLGDDIQPRRPSESSDDFEDRKRRREELIRRNRNELIRRAREEGIAVDLDELAKIGAETAEVAAKRSRADRSKSFDDMVGSDGTLKNKANTTGTDTAKHDIRRRGAAGFAAGSAAAAVLANPFDDDATLLDDNHHNETPSPEPSVSKEADTRESSATIEADAVSIPPTGALVDLTPAPETSSSPAPPQPDEADQAAQSFYSFTSADSHPPVPRPESPIPLSTGTLTPRSDRSMTLASASSPRPDHDILSMQNDTDHDARSEIFSEGGFTDAFSEGGFSEFEAESRTGIMTPSEWSHIGSDDDNYSASSDTLAHERAKRAVEVVTQASSSAFLNQGTCSSNTIKVASPELPTATMSDNLNDEEYAALQEHRLIERINPNQRKISSSYLSPPASSAGSPSSSASSVGRKIFASWASRPVTSPDLLYPALPLSIATLEFIGLNRDAPHHMIGAAKRSHHTGLIHR